jgi:hypothetical protein
MEEWAELVVEKAVEGLEICGHADITKVVENPEDEGLYDGIEVVKYDDKTVVVGGWMRFFKDGGNTIVELYQSGHRGEPTLFKKKEFDEVSFAVAWAMGRMMEAELIECL